MRSRTVSRRVAVLAAVISGVFVSGCGSDDASGPAASVDDVLDAATPESDSSPGDVVAGDEVDDLGPTDATVAPDSAPNGSDGEIASPVDAQSDGASGDSETLLDVGQPTPTNPRLNEVGCGQSFVELLGVGGDVAVPVDALALRHGSELFQLPAGSLEPGGLIVVPLTGAFAISACGDAPIELVGPGGVVLDQLPGGYLPGVQSRGRVAYEYKLWTDANCALAKPYLCDLTGAPPP